MNDSIKAISINLVLWNILLIGVLHGIACASVFKNCGKKVK